MSIYAVEKGQTKAIQFKINELINYRALGERIVLCRYVCPVFITVKNVDI